MPITWTTEQVIALSPDDKSTKNGKGLANPSKWQTLGHLEQAIWGECKGSGKNPYRTQIDLQEPAFRCSCPSRKFPCKHALGLFLLLASQANIFTETSPPEWVQTWLDKRSQTTQAKAEKKQSAVPADPDAQIKRAAKREEKIQAGIADLDLWLRDLIRQGLAAIQTQSYRYWDQPAARMVDAQAPGLAKRLREMSGISHRGKDWPRHLLSELGKLHLLIQGYQRIDSLPTAVQAELRSQIGWTLKQEELLALAEQPKSEIETIHDTWSVLGRRVTEEENLSVQRVWLQGSLGRSALILSFAYGSTPLDTSLVPGSDVEADLVFYPGLYPMRAIVKQRHQSRVLPPPETGISIAEAMEIYGTAIAQNPWLLNLPLLLNQVTPCPLGSDWCLVDQEGHQIPFHKQFAKPWALIAQSGGHPLTVFGEWDGQSFFPLGVWVENNFRMC